MTDVSGGTVVAFLNEVAGGRKLLEALKARVEAGAERIVLVAPQNQPLSGQIVDREEVREAAQSRVDVTQAVLGAFGIKAETVIFDPDPPLALDDAVRTFKPAEVLVSALAETHFGPQSRDLIEWIKARTDTPITHIPVRIENDAVRWDVTHTLVVATQTVSSPDLVARLRERAADSPHRYTFICPRSGAIEREEVCRRLASTLATLYRDEVDATGQPMSPEPVAAVRNAIEHYRVDDILISTLAGQSSVWLEEGLIEKTQEITEMPIEHVESGAGVGSPEAEQAEAVAAAVGEGEVS